jgi:hypothetical protein
MSIFQSVSTEEDRNYPYQKFIKTPSEMGSSNAGTLTALGKDINAMGAYVDVLTTGGSRGHIGGVNALGNKYFMKTGATCNAPNGKQPRYIFINNIPNGSFAGKGLVPGALENITYINPLKLFTAFSQGTSCQQITMETRDIKNATSTESQYVLNDDISSYNACWFKDKKNPVTNETCREGMTMPKDTCAQLYLTGLGIVGIYILHRLLHKRI